jgi:hypothetical protein
VAFMPMRRSYRGRWWGPERAVVVAIPTHGFIGLSTGYRGLIR